MDASKTIYSYFDGACSDPVRDGNLGLGYHANFELEKEGSLLRKSVSGGVGTNNEAEFKALISLMKDLLKIGAQNNTVIIKGDSQTVIDMVLGNKNAVNPRMRAFMSEVDELKSKFNHIIFTQVPRHKNSLADHLSKKGLKDKVRDYYNYKF